ncbi:N-acetyltransferase [Adhaeribacter aerolatus]|uniref:N-acetyltransferase n=1 Tax=Adhaeribacter aerolatus TaxID=670289 RepID=A0A512B519_9BACT|nr:GNAT family N-acetyltransferase [Adhaeribacter aerolatus]GEO07075.1 N-acetyltransferase [Adhaeribacter aerolatus]
MLTLTRTDATNPEFIQLVRLLDEDLRIRDGEDHSFFAQFNKIDAIRHVVVAQLNGMPVGCGAVKAYTNQVGEIKRMYMRPEFRQQGIASFILKELEKWALELNFKEVILETGKAQPEAINLYTKSGYQVMPNYGQYEHVESSVCMKKPTSLA